MITIIIMISNMAFGSHRVVSIDEGADALLIKLIPKEVGGAHGRPDLRRLSIAHVTLSKPLLLS